MYFTLLTLGLSSFVLASSRGDGLGKPSAWLMSLVWLIIPFVPASAVFLRLGTLLAERLLYIPSIGFCFVMSLVIHSISRTLRRIPSIQRLVYWTMIIVIAGLYSYRTREYNLTWKDDATLFVQSLEVCPRSAKLNLQVAKLRVNEGNFEAAMKHIWATKDIDPDFCDVGYQEALVQLGHFHSVEGAIDAGQCHHSIFSVAI